MSGAVDWQKIHQAVAETVVPRHEYPATRF